GTTLTGECAEAAADCGLSAIDFAPFEQLIDVVRAAHDRCREYDQTRWLAERERSFDTEDTEEQRAQNEERRLRRRPTSRERYLAQCVPAPLLDSSFFQAREGDASTNYPGALGYDLRLAPAAPQPR